ncbi:hypothetical protein [Marinicrinis lubricantis]
MEWNFLFRIDHLKETGEERNLKGLIVTENDQPPKVEQIQSFLRSCGYNADVQDAHKLIFRDSNPEDPVDIRIIQLEDQEVHETDRILKLISEQFIK